MNRQLCVDVRAAVDFPWTGIPVQGLVEDLQSDDSALGEPGACDVRWLAHARQQLGSRVQQANTRLRVGASLLHWLWERRFVKEAQIHLFFRFAPVDQLPRPLPCATITTLVPRSGAGRPPLKRRRDRNDLLVVPSESDRRRVEKLYGTQAAGVRVIRPTIRRSFLSSAAASSQANGYLLIVLPERVAPAPARRLHDIMGYRFPALAQKTLRLNESQDSSPGVWQRMLQHASICFYLASHLCDWPTLALEAIHMGVPLVFSDDNAALSELLPDSPLRLSRFLIDQSEPETLGKATVEAKETLLRTSSVFSPGGMLSALSRMSRDLLAC